MHSSRSRENSWLSPIGEMGWQICSYLFNLDALDGQRALLIKAIEEIELPTLHDWMLLLRNLVALREI
jgi:hypothetical protein